jgi:threonine dehydrogenase-like Zn-dependent dehydrogenase
MNAIAVLVREISIVGSLGYGRNGATADFEVALDLLARHGEAIRRELVTHRFPLSRIDEAFRAASDKSHGAIKVSVRPEG